MTNRPSTDGDDEQKVIDDGTKVMFIGVKVQLMPSVEVAKLMELLARQMPANTGAEYSVRMRGEST